MGRRIEIELDEAKRVFFCLEELVQFLHQPKNYGPEVAEWLERGAYAELHEVFYRVVRGWLPEDVQREIEEREGP